MNRKKAIAIIGTRPEALKIIPVILELKRYKKIDIKICATGQHREMLAQVLDLFHITPDHCLDLMTRNQDLSTLTTRLLVSLDRYLKSEKPDIVIVQGDTTSAFVAALATFYQHIPVAHIEAGLRSHDKFSPFPEEINRVFISNLSDLHFAPTSWARNNLIREGIPASQIFITGNTIIDMIRLAKVPNDSAATGFPWLPKRIMDGRQDLVLITGHRRESFGRGFREICKGIKLLSKALPDTIFVYPVHLNPNVSKPVRSNLGNIKNIYLLKPLDYPNFLRLMKRATLILTDSGGIQEEAPSLKKPVLIMRSKTERPEALLAGTAKLVGTDSKSIFRETKRLLEDKKLYAQMIKPRNPFGDGRAAYRIARICKRFLNARLN